MECLVQIFWIGVFGALGAILRYFISIHFNDQGKIPWGTSFVNVLGSFLIGVLFFYLMNSKSFFGSPVIHRALIVGLLGGITTFSAFSFESLSFIQSGQLISAMTHISINLVGGIFFCGLGLKLASLM